MEVAQAEDRIATLPDVIEALYAPVEDAAPRPNLSEFGLVDQTQVTAWGLDLAMDLERFVKGDLAGLIDGETSDGVDWDAPLLVFDTSELDEDGAALSLVMTLVTTFLSSVWAKKPGIQRFIVLEEGYHAARLEGVGSVSVAGILRSLVKRGRGIGLSFVVVVHHIADLVGSDAYSLIKESQIVHCYRQSTDEDVAQVIRMFGFPADAAPLLRGLDQGTQIIRIGTEPPRMLQHLRTPLEVDITGTDEGMLGATTDSVQASPADAADAAGAADVDDDSAA